MKRILCDFGKGGQNRGYKKARATNWTFSPSDIERYIDNYKENLTSNYDSDDITILEKDLVRYVRFSLQEAVDLSDRLNAYIRALETFDRSKHSTSDIDYLADSIYRSGITFSR